MCREADTTHTRRTAGPDSQDMRNGFLLGELLFRHNQLHSFGKFQRTNSSDAKINNFCLVESSLRAMNVKFDAQTANAIMQGKPGAASTVLYKVWAGVGGGWSRNMFFWSAA